MSIKLMTQTWEWAMDVKGSTLLVLLSLADHANDEGICWPSIPRLAKRARISERQVQYALGSLEKDGFLIREQLGGGSHKNTTVYRVTIRQSAPCQHGREGTGEVGFTCTGEVGFTQNHHIEPSSSSASQDSAEPLLPADSSEDRENNYAKLSPEDKRSLCSMLYGHDNVRVLPREGHIVIGKLWKTLARAGFSMPTVLDWYASIWLTSWPGNTGRPPRPNEVVNGVAAHMAENAQKGPEEGFEFVVVDNDE